MFPITTTTAYRWRGDRLFGGQQHGSAFDGFLVSFHARCAVLHGCRLCPHGSLSGKPCRLETEISAFASGCRWVYCERDSVCRVALRSPTTYHSLTGGTKVG